MAKRLTNTVIIGDDKRLGLYFYYSLHFGQNIIRKRTSLTGERVKTDKAFMGFRDSSNRMKQASPIAASLYKLIPAETKQYSIYRLLMSETLKMIREGHDTSVIVESLRRTYIEPLTGKPEKESNQNENIASGKDHLAPGLKSFIGFPDQTPHNRRRIIKRKRSQLLHADRTTRFQPASEVSNEQDRAASARLSILSLAREKYRHVPKSKEERIPGLIYLCRLKECKSLKLWARIDGFPGVFG